MKIKHLTSKSILPRILLIAALSLGAVGYAVYNGLPAGNDLPQHYRFAAAIYESLSHGEVYPGFASLANNGLSDYGIRFYPPLSYYAISSLYAVTGSWYAASFALVFLVFFFGGAGMYLWLREETSPNQAMIAAGLFIFAPYHLNQIYNNFLFAEFAASAVIPFCFLFLHRAARRGRISDLAGLAAAFSVLILTHLPSLIICSAAFTVYGLALVLRSPKRLANIIKLSVSILVSLAATSFYWIKLVTELDWINHSSDTYFSHIYDYRNNFLLRPQNILNFTDDVLSLWLGDLMLVVTLVVAVPAFIYIVRKRGTRDALLSGGTLVLIMSAFMASFLSKPVWDYVALFQKVQFPWRWLGLVSVAGAAVASYGIYNASEKMRSGSSPVLTVSLGAVLLLFLFTSFFIMKQATFIPPDQFTNGTVATLARAASFEAWWTVWAKPNFYKEVPEKVSAGRRKVKLVYWGKYEKQFRVGQGRAEFADIGQLYYPHWKAEADGTRLPVRASPKGLLRIGIPKEGITVRLAFIEPATVIAAQFVSAASWTLLVAVFIWALANKMRKSGESGQEAPMDKSEE